MVVAANFAFEKAYPKKEENLYGEKVEQDNQSWDGFIETETYEHEPATLEEQAKHTDWEEAAEGSKEKAAKEEIVEVEQPLPPSTYADRYKRKDTSSTKKTYM